MCSIGGVRKTDATSLAVRFRLVGVIDVEAGEREEAGAAVKGGRSLSTLSPDAPPYRLINLAS